MATIAVGDIHGNLQALTDVLGQLRREVVAGDVVVFLGDYVDRWLQGRHGGDVWSLGQRPRRFHGVAKTKDCGPDHRD